MTIKELNKLPAKTKTYKHLSRSGQLLEQWQRDENGDWHDVTNQELAKQEIEEAARELLKLENRAKTATQEVQVACPEDDFDELIDFEL